MDTFQRRPASIGNKIRDMYLIKEYDDLNFILLPKIVSLVDTQLWMYLSVGEPISRCTQNIDIAIRETIINGN
jgi:hypothetical protein